jgi:hypothetical protein
MAAPRSPRYPLIDLPSSIALIRKVWKAEGRNTMSPEVAAKHMGYKGINGASLRTIATLRKFRLLEGRGDDVKVSDDAITILADEETKSPERAEAIKRSAFNEGLYAELKAKFSTKPSETNLRAYLIKNGFSEDAARTATAVYLSTLEFVEKETSGYTTQSGSGTPQPVKIGDYVQWESAGQLQFEIPRRVREIADGGEFAFVEGSETGVPMNELTIQSPPSGAQMRQPPISRVVPSVSEIANIRVTKDCAIRLLADGPYNKRSIEALVKNLQLQLELGTYDDLKPANDPLLQ